MYEIRDGQGVQVGNHNVQHNIYERHVHAPAVITPMERVEAPAGLINLPERSALFVGRGGEMRRLREAITASSPGSVVVTAVHGLGGIGKSALAAHYADTHRAGHSLVWWITADAPTSIETGLARLAVALQPAVGTLPLEQQTEHGLRWLATHGGWLLILDNLPGPNDAAALLARLPGGQVLITSRRTTGWHDITTTPLSLDVLEPGQARELLTRILTHDDPGADAVCAELGYLPLAIEQAGAFMVETGTTAGEYLDLLGRYPAAMYGETAEGGDTQRTMARIWRVTLDRLADTPLAGKVLRVLAWYAPDDIPVALLSDLDDELAVIKSLGRLAAYAMITRTGEAIGVHRLVQAVTRTPDPDDVHRTPADVAHARERATRALSRALQPLDPEAPQDWPVLRVLMPHAQALVSNTDPEDDTGDTIFVLGQLGRFLGNQGTVAMATGYLDRCLVDCVRVLGPDHPVTLTSRNNLAAAYESEGNLRQAIQLYRAALADRERVLGPDHADTLVSRSNLAFAYRSAGSLEQAIPLHEATLVDRERVLGRDHPDTLTSRNNLAGAYETAGDLRQAIPLYKAVLADRERVQGPDHPDTLASRNNLAGAYRSAGDPGRAIPLYEATLADCERVLGADHPRTLTSRNNLAGAYEMAGDLRQAIPLYEANLADRERVLGPDHPSTLTSRNNLAAAYEMTGKLGQAIPLYEATLADCERVLGPDHPDTLISRNNLAYAYWLARDLGRAIPLHVATLAARERVLGPHHPHTLSSRYNLAAAYESAGDLRQAIPLYKAVYSAYKRILGPGHPETQAVRASLRRARGR
ncbi:FxSxx-COOH system tetratricopeptide repeat protein [Amycolatopsis oliviviridis]|uniref:Tetratricopeptide repeat protein n=1 Tax=Amycolatopsis oliviviridis TaxID=1471590 RepID=A0ABQ3L8L4_9PSEU|nr:tetratricopeptide repeat protein [Amycolatopsis oliviviridis]